MNWVEAIKGQAGDLVARSNTRRQLTEVMLLGIVALRAGQKIHYDGAKMKITNSVASSDQPLEGEQLLRRQYRPGLRAGGYEDAVTRSQGSREFGVQRVRKGSRFRFNEVQASEP